MDPSTSRPLPPDAKRPKKRTAFSDQCEYIDVYEEEPLPIYDDRARRAVRDMAAITNAKVLIQNDTPPDPAAPPCVLSAHLGQNIMGIMPPQSLVVPLPPYELHRIADESYCLIQKTKDGTLALCRDVSCDVLQSLKYGPASLLQRQMADCFGPLIDPDRHAQDLAEVLPPDAFAPPNHGLGHATQQAIQIRCELVAVKNRGLSLVEHGCLYLREVARSMDGVLRAAADGLYVAIRNNGTFAFVIVGV